MTPSPSHPTASPNSRHTGGWVFYDGDCAWCIAAVRRFNRTLARRGYRCEPLQAPWVLEHLALRRHELLRELRVLTAEGTVLGGANALLHLAGDIWWARPIAWLGRIGALNALFHLLYREAADHRHCGDGICRFDQGRHHHGARAFFTMP